MKEKRSSSKHAALRVVKAERSENDTILKQESRKNYWIKHKCDVWRCTCEQI